MIFIKRKAIESATLFVFGAAVYVVLEMLWRGRTHWSMALAGGVCLAALGVLRDIMEGRPLILKCLAGAALITAVEFIAGCVVNLWLGWRIWDYTAYELDFLGQICARYYLLWAAACLPAFLICRAVRRFWEVQLGRVRAKGA